MNDVGIELHAKIMDLYQDAARFNRETRGTHIDLVKRYERLSASATNFTSYHIDDALKTIWRALCLQN